mgnify:CR=1 FL=1
MMNLKRVVVLVALLAPVSCGNCEDKRATDRQPGTPQDPVRTHPSAREFKFTPKALLDGGSADPAPSASP